MSDWTEGAREYLEGYLRQVGALARENGDDDQEILEQLRDHVAHEVESAGIGLVTLDHVRRLLDALGSPELVVQGEWKSSAPSGAAALPPPPPRPAPAAPQVIIRDKRSPAFTCAVVAIAAVIVLPILIAIIGIVSAITLPAMSRAREAARRASCQNNLKQIGMLVYEYEQKHGKLPPLSTTPGVLMVDLDAFETPSIRELLRCPSRPDTAVKAAADGDACYLYLPYVLRNIEDAVSFRTAYEATQSASVSMEGGVQLRETQIEGWPGEGIPVADIPLIIERPGAHIPSGCNVLFLDGHVEFIRMNEKWPVIPAFFEQLHFVDKLDGDRGLNEYMIGEHTVVH